MRIATQTALLLGVAMALVAASSSSAMPVAHWSFDNEDDPGHDDSGNGHQAVNRPVGDLNPVWDFGSGPTWHSEGDDGYLSFDSVDDYVKAFWTEVEQSQVFDEYRIRIRFGSPDFSSGSLIRRADGGGSYSDNFSLYAMDDGSGRAVGTHEYTCCENAFVYTKEGVDLGDNVWHWLELAYDGEVLRIYRDDELDDSLTCDGPAYGQHTPSVISIGAYGFMGDISDIQIYIPEPATLTLVALGVAMTMGKRRRR